MGATLVGPGGGWGGGFDDPLGPREGRDDPPDSGGGNAGETDVRFH